MVLFEPCWNPTNNIQALSRVRFFLSRLAAGAGADVQSRSTRRVVQAYRQGQTREVVVYHLVGAGTLEEHIHRRSLQKTALAAYAQIILLLLFLLLLFRFIIIF